ncbi:MAG: hypothetical protein WHT46_10690 [Candidatus Geothermincolales bacterium]
MSGICPAGRYRPGGLAARGRRGKKGGRSPTPGEDRTLEKLINQTGKV